MVGSSPLARGGPHPKRVWGRSRGLIPARAGRTACSGVVCRGEGAHPRSRGADNLLTDESRSFEGSSPLARGGLGVRAGGRPCGGLIPARAGRTLSDATSRRSDRAHPRSRGADRLRVAADPADEGSSPLARGGHHRHGPTPADVGLIPARAGRTSSPRSIPSRTRAHPRSRGADRSARRASRVAMGSSPLARGGPGAARVKAENAGLIPARAGRTPKANPSFHINGAHPRSRGADSAFNSQTGRGGGSSPLARGGRLGAFDGDGRAGLIPARAGRTPARLLRPWRRRAHPRSRGADSSTFRLVPRMMGSSPLARGGLEAQLVAGAAHGLIPARAGRTPDSRAPSS